MRLIITEDGKQYPAFPNGTPFSRVISTIVSQDADQSSLGMATVTISMYVRCYYSRFRGNEFCKLELSGNLTLHENEYHIANWSLKSQREDDEPFILEFTALAFPDPTQ